MHAFTQHLSLGFQSVSSITLNFASRIVVIGFGPRGKEEKRFELKGVGRLSDRSIACWGAIRRNWWHTVGGDDDDDDDGGLRTLSESLEEIGKGWLVGLGLGWGWGVVGLGNRVWDGFQRVLWFNHFFGGRIVADFDFRFVFITFIHASTFALAPHSLSHSDMITPSLALDAIEIGWP